MIDSIAFDEVSEVVQLPVIIVSGKIQMLSPDLLKLDSRSLRDVAALMGGRVTYLKVRATYSTLETVLCSRYNCYRPVGQSKNGECGDHV